MSNSLNRNPVVLVHGIDDTASKFNTMRGFLESQGWPTHALSLTPNDGRVGLEHLAKQLSTYIESTVDAHQPIDLIGFSMGGIVSRYYVQRLAGIQRVQRFITLASPHNGTWLAYLRNNAGAAQMRRWSTFLAELNGDVEMLSQIQFTSIWTPLDLMIVPAHSSRLPVGDNLQIPVMSHPWMVRDARCLAAIATLLSTPLDPSTPISPAYPGSPDRRGCYSSSSSSSPDHPPGAAVLPSDH